MGNLYKNLSIKCQIFFITLLVGYSVSAKPISSLPFISSVSMYAPSGAGTISDPYLIASLANLSWLSQNSDVWDDNAYFTQTANIDLSATQYWDYSDDDSDGDLYNDANDLTSTGNNEGFLPIGTYSTKFDGTYTGGGYLVQNLYINRTDVFDVGFFGVIENASVSELGISNLTINSRSNIGGLVGSCISSSLSYCFASGTITGLNEAVYSNIFGGLVGSINTTSISNSYSLVSISTVSSSIMHAGGLAGYSSSASTISNCYSAGVISASFGGSGGVGGLLGSSSSSTITNSFWDTEISTQSLSAAGTGKTTSEMKTVSTFTNSTWDFEIETSNGTNNYWDIDLSNTINSGYPFLAWENGETIAYDLTAPTITQTSLNTANTAISVTFSEAVYNSAGANLEVTDFNLSIAGGTASLVSATPTSISINGNVYTLGFTLTGSVNGNEIISVAPLSSSVFDASVNSASTSQSNNTATLFINSVIPSGSGTNVDPYLISSVGHLSWLTQTSSVWDDAAYFTQTVNLDLTATQYWDYTDDDSDGDLFNDSNDVTSSGTNEGFKPIAAFGSFTGTYSGGGFLIENMYITRTSGYTGFFANLSSATVSKLGVKNATISSFSHTGVLCGSINSSSVSECYSSGTITNGSSTLTSRSYGGLVGVVTASTISNCYSTVDLTLSTTSSPNVAGLAGYLASSSILENTYSIGIISGTFTKFKGLISVSSSSTVTNSFWDTEVSTQSLSAGGTGKTTTEMKTVSTFTSSNWDFEVETSNGSSNYWDIDLSAITNSGYPFLAWENGATVSYDTTVPTLTSSAMNSGNASFEVTFSEAVYNAIGASGSLEASDFSLSISGGNATLTSATPTSISVSGNVYTLGFTLSGAVNGQEIVTVVPASSSSIYDASGNSAATSQSNNSKNLQINSTSPSGSGTSGDPYAISSVANLSWLSQNSANWASYFGQSENIDLSITQYWDDSDDDADGDLYNDPNDATSAGNNEGFKPIGNTSVKFTGSYDGGGTL